MMSLVLIRYDAVKDLRKSEEM